MKRPFIFRVCNRLLKETAPLFPDELFLRLKFYFVMGEKLDLEHPKTFNQKLQWLKLHDKHAEYTMMVDKIEAKKYVASIIGDEYIIPTLGVYDSVEEIDFEKLPNQFVLKCSHDSGGVVVCKDKATLDKTKALKKLKKGLKTNFNYDTREYPYKNVKPRIIAEEYMEDESGYELKDYKIFCFDGEPKMSFVASDRQKEGEDTKFDFYDLDWNRIPVTNGHPSSKHGIPTPPQLQEYA